MADRPINRPTIHTLAYRPRIFTVVWEMYAWLGGCANWLIAFTAANVGDGTNVVDTRYTEMIKSPAPQDHMAYVKRWGWLRGFTNIIHEQRRFVKLLQRGESTAIPAAATFSANHLQRYLLLLRHHVALPRPLAAEVGDDASEDGSVPSRLLLGHFLHLGDVLDARRPDPPQTKRSDWTLKTLHRSTAKLTVRR